MTSSASIWYKSLSDRHIVKILHQSLLLPDLIVDFLILSQIPNCPVQSNGLATLLVIIVNCSAPNRAT